MSAGATEKPRSLHSHFKLFGSSYILQSHPYARNGSYRFREYISAPVSVMIPVMQTLKHLMNKMSLSAPLRILDYDSS